jgi:hypothetical protein
VSSVTLDSDTFCSATFKFLCLGYLSKQINELYNTMTREVY